VNLLSFLFHGICHQIGARSLSSGDFTMPLCARCAGMYIGFLLALPAFLASALRRRSSGARPFVPAACVAAALWLADGAANVLGLWQTPNAARFAVGAALGLSLSPFLASLFASAVVDGAPAKTAPRLLWLPPLVLAAALSVANARPSRPLLVAESFAAAAGLLGLLVLVHSALLMLVLRTRRIPVAVAVSCLTVSSQVYVLSSLRSLLGA
jgi:uncharacterized membrane protein